MESDDIDRDAFGYGQDPRVRPVHGVQVAEGKEPDTLLPAVVLYVRELEGEEQVGFALSPDLAEGLAGELVRMAARAREKHWE